VLAAISAWLAACGTSGPALSEYPIQRLHAQCAQLARCGEYPDEDTCVTLLPLFEPSSLDAAVAEKLVTYHPDSAQSCLDELSSAPCDTTQKAAREQPACDRVFTGNGKTGATCAFGQECVSGFCDVPSCQTSCCLGACTAPAKTAAIGESCAAAACGSGAYCDDTQTCQALLPMGVSCSSTDQCAYGLGCTVYADSTCEPLPAVGASCAATKQCADLGVNCTTAGICTAAVQVGEICSDSLDCVRYASCDRTDRCAITDPLLPDGAVCSGNDMCTSGFCDASMQTPTCEDPPLCY